MKPVKNLVFAALLTFSIAFNAFGGDIDLPGAKPTPEPPRLVVSNPETDTDSQETTVETADYLWYEVVTAFLSVY